MAVIPEHLEEKIKTIPEKPGVYQMKDRDGNIIYIGKSKNLKSRVKSYFYGDHNQQKIKQMVSRVHDIDIIPTDTHLEARVLECDLIKRLKPLYNRQFKNDRGYYVYLRVGDDSRSKPLAIVDEKTDDNCIGPYRSRSRLLKAVEMLGNVYPVIKCGSQYCFQYSVLPHPMNDEDFNRNRQCLLEILFTRECMDVFLCEIEKKMEEASSKLQFELATVYRDMLGHVKYIGKGRPGGSGYEDRDIFMGERIEDGYKVFYISYSRIVMKKKYKRLTRKSIEIFLNNVRGLREAREYVADEKRQLDFKMIITAELRDTNNKAVEFIDGSFDTDRFLTSLAMKKPVF